MAEKKSQHFVPQFYLRNFSNDRKRVNLFLLKSGSVISGAPLRPQCAEDYFYGQDLGMENALGALEGATGHVLRRILRDARLPEPGSEADVVFRTYVAIQWGRTRSHVTDSTASLSRTLKAAFAEAWKAKGGKEADLQDLEIKPAEAARDSVARTAELLAFLGDLEVKLLLANGLGEFVTSDTPVVLTNPFYLGRYHGGVTGLDAAGLVMLAVNNVPLADAMFLMRHSDPKLTMRIYTDASQLALSDALAKLPVLLMRMGQCAYC